MFAYIKKKLYLCTIEIKIITTLKPKSRKGTKIMAKYTINHTCGHQVTVQLFGKYDERERRIQYLETLECEECRKAKANAAAEAAKELRGLAELTGSEKQVAWANTIREGAYKALDCLAPFATNDKVKEVIADWKAKMDAQTEAKWWIDNRYNMPKPLVNSTTGETDQSAARSIVSDFKTLFM